MSQIIKVDTCRHNGTILTKYEFDDVEYEKLLCENCIDYVTRQSNFKIILEVPIPQ